MTTVSLIQNPMPRRFVLGLAAALLAVPMLSGASMAASLDEIKPRGLIVATEDDFRPFEFVKDGKAVGARVRRGHGLDRPLGHLSVQRKL